MTGVRRLGRGLSSALAGLLFPLGGWWLGRLHDLGTADRLGRGLAVVLPGIEGWGPLNREIARGLAAGGFPGAVEVHDWTTGLWPLFPFHLRAERRARRRAAAVARRVADYRERYPGRPVHLVGHSGGTAVAVWALESLPPGRAVTSAVLLGASLSAGYDLGPALARVEQCVWHFWTPGDWFFLGAGIVLVGTSDGRHRPAAGCLGFRPPAAGPGRLRQRVYQFRLLRQFHGGGHLGWANRVFVAESVAQLLTAGG